MQLGWRLKYTLCTLPLVPLLQLGKLVAPALLQCRCGAAGGRAGWDKGSKGFKITWHRGRILYLVSFLAGGKQHDLPDLEASKRKEIF